MKVEEGKTHDLPPTHDLAYFSSLPNKEILKRETDAVTANVIGLHSFEVDEQERVKLTMIYESDNDLIQQHKQHCG